MALLPLWNRRPFGVEVGRDEMNPPILIYGDTIELGHMRLLRSGAACDVVILGEQADQTEAGCDHRILGCQPALDANQEGIGEGGSKTG